MRRQSLGLGEQWYGFQIKNRKGMCIFSPTSLFASLTDYQCTQ